MTKKTYSNDVFFDLKDQTKHILEDPLKSLLETITNIIDNNYGISYHEKNNKHKHKGKKRYNKENEDIISMDKWRLKKTIINKEINSDLDKYKYEINSLLNKLSPKNFDTISKKILDYYEKELEEEDLNNLLISFIDSIFSKAVMQPIYCPYYVKFLNMLDDKYTIIHLINSKCNDFRQVFTISKIEKENMTEQEAYDQFCQDNLDKVFKAGYSQFIGELFNNKMIELDIIISNIDFFVQSLTDSVDNQELFENIIICITQLIKTTSEQLKLIKYDYEQINKTLNSIYKNFTGVKRLKFKLLDLCDYINKII